MSGDILIGLLCGLSIRLLLWVLPFELPTIITGWRRDGGWFVEKRPFRWKANSDGGRDD